MDIGVVIKKYRKEAGMTQEEMALHDENEEIQHHAADSLFGFYLRKKDYTKAEKYLDYFSEYDPMKSYYLCAGKDVEGTYKVVKHLLDNVGTMYVFRKSGLYKHMKFRDVDEAILDGVEQFLDKKLHRQPASCRYML